MDTNDSIQAFAALAQSTRLEAFRHLVSAEPQGLPAGDLARLLEVPQNTLSAHLAVLARAGLVSSERRSRSIVYRANLDMLGGVVLFLLKDCCGGAPSVCEPLIAQLTAPCVCAPEVGHG
jgi:ArsR family transcriptional regulator, arsenate/arsenite/antimonite-responsive transcriptional repressor